MPDKVRVCGISELQPGDKIAIETKGVSILVVNVDGKFYAVSNICTHEYAELVNGIIIDDEITCPLHLSRFKLASGEVLNPPATEPLRTYKVVLDWKDIFVEI